MKKSSKILAIGAALFAASSISKASKKRKENEELNKIFGMNTPSDVEIVETNGFEEQINKLNSLYKSIKNYFSEILNFKVDKEVPLFIFIGESNSEGRALNSSATAGELEPRSNCKIWNVDNSAFEDLDIGTNNIWNDNAQFQTNKALWHGWELELANRGLDRIGYTKIFIVKAGQGGSLVTDWNDTTDLNYTKFVSRVTNAKNAISALGLIPKVYVFQSLGINDAIAVTNPTTFLSNLLSFHINIRSFLGINTPIIQTQIMPNNANYIAINNKIIEATNNTNTFNVSVDSLPLIDSNHWDYTGMKILANRLLDVAVDKIGLPNNISGRVVSNLLPTWDYIGGNAILNGGISKAIVRPKVEATDWQLAPFRVEAFNNSAKFGYCYYNTITNRFVIGGVTAGTSNDPVEIAPLSTLFAALLNVSGLMTAAQINATLGFFQLSAQNGDTQNQAIVKIGNSTNINSFGWFSHDATDGTTYFGSVLSGVAHKNIVLCPISGGAVGIGGKPKLSAILDLTSTNKGFLSPRMTTTQRDAISTPEEGLEIYNLTTHVKEYFNGTIWKTIATV